MNQGISLTIITKNEESNINTYFNWLKDIKTINEIILVDDFSTDKTKNILKNKIGKHQKIRIFNRHLNNDFSRQRQFSISKSKNNWILWLDADEKPSFEMLKFLNDFSFEEKYNAYSFTRNEIFWGKVLNYGQNKPNLVRLFNKTKGRFIGKVHEIWQTSNVFYTKTTFTHHSCKDFTHLLQKVNFYTDIRSTELYKQKVKTNIFQIIFYPAGKFLYNYIFKLGFLDGTRGIILSLVMSFHTFLVRAKLWHLYKQSSST